MLNFIFSLYNLCPELERKLSLPTYSSARQSVLFMISKNLCFHLDRLVIIVSSVSGCALTTITLQCDIIRKEGRSA